MTQEEAYKIIDLLAANPVNHAVVIKGILAMIDDVPVAKKVSKKPTYVTGVKPSTGKRPKADSDFPKRKCENCGKSYTPTGSRQKYCPECSKMIRKSRQDARNKARYSKDLLSLASELASMDK